LQAVVSSRTLVITNMAKQRRYQRDHKTNLHRRNNLKYYEIYSKIKTDDSYGNGQGWRGNWTYISPPQGFIKKSAHRNEGNRKKLIKKSNHF
jgi:hypothetical protein